MQYGAFGYADLNGVAAIFVTWPEVTITTRSRGWSALDYKPIVISEIARYTDIDTADYKLNHRLICDIIKFE